jgi:hypothetical protein
MFRILALGVVFLCAAFAHGARAGAGDAEMHSLRRLIAATHAQGYAQAETLVTERSRPFLARLWQHGVPYYFPQEVRLEKEKKRGAFRYLWIAPADDAPESENAGSAILAYTTEGGTAKLDLPETFRNGFGEDWEKKLAIMEQGYAMAKAQFGEAVAPEVLRGMIQGYQKQPQ